MKRRFLFFASLILAIVSCQNNELESIENVTYENIEQVEVAFSFTGEYIEVSEEYLGTRATETDKVYYAFDIDTLKIDTYTIDGLTYNDTTYINYAEGLFTSKENMRLLLPQNRKYRVNAAIVKEIGDVLYHEDNFYYAPFCESVNNGGVELKNEFVISSTSNYNLDQIWINTYEKHKFHIHPMIDRYFGSVFYEPTGNKATIEIELDRYAFGLKISITPPSDGKIILTSQSPQINYVVESTDGTLEENHIYATSTTSDTYRRNPDYAEKLYFNLTWERENGEDNIEMQKTIEVRRNTRKIINVNLNNRENESDFNLTEEAGMKDEEVNIN